MQVLDRTIALLGLDPFTYLVVTIFGIATWVWCNMVGGIVLTGRGLWIRRASLVLAGAGAILFAYSAHTLH